MYGSYKRCKKDRYLNTLCRRSQEKSWAVSRVRQLDQAPGLRRPLPLPLPPHRAPAGGAAGPRRGRLQRVLPVAVRARAVADAGHRPADRAAGEARGDGPGRALPGLRGRLACPRTVVCSIDASSWSRRPCGRSGACDCADRTSGTSALPMFVTT